jgi:hypothetical protein
MSGRSVAPLLKSGSSVPSVSPPNLGMSDQPRIVSEREPSCSKRSAAAVGRIHLPASVVVVMRRAGGLGFARSFKWSSILSRGTPFVSQSGAGPPIR